MKLSQVQIELVGRCNLSCPYCTWQERTVGKGRDMDYDLAIKLIDQCAELKVDLVTYHALGESLLHPQFNDIVQYANKKILYNRLATNCTLLMGDDARVLSRLRSFQLVLSVHWAAGEKFALRAVENIREYLGRKPQNREVRIQMVCDVKAQGDYQRFVDTFLPMVEGVDNAILYFKQPCTFPTDTKPNYGFMPKITHPKVIMDLYETPYSIGHNCTQPHYFLSVLADGSVVPCCVGMEDWGLPGVTEQTLQQIWESARMREIRRLWAAKDDSIPCGFCLKRKDCA